MFIRYSLTSHANEVAKRFAIDVPEGYQPHYNAAPSHLLPIITQDSPQGLSFFYWGAPPSWANKKPLGEKIINTRLELITEKPTLQKKLREKRCIIPADGFYEWKRAGLCDYKKRAARNGLGYIKKKHSRICSFID